MRIGDLFLAGGAAYVGVDGSALDRTGPDQRDLDREVVELPRLEPGQGADLSATLDLEHPDRVGPAQHVVDGRLVAGNRVQRPPLAEVLGDDLHRVVDSPEHAEAQQVELDQAHPFTGVLVPLQHRAVVHPAALDRADLPHGSLGQDHPARMDAQVPWLQ